MAKSFQLVFRWVFSSLAGEVALAGANQKEIDMQAN